MNVTKMIKVTKEDEQFKDVFKVMMKSAIKDNILEVAAFFYAMGMYRSSGGEVVKE